MTLKQASRSAPRERLAPTRRGRPARHPAPTLDMRDHILDHGEALFASHGLHGVTIREVARAAKVDPALIHYYFGTKTGLFDAVFARRAAVLNVERMHRMEAYSRHAGEHITIEGVIDAFLEPILRQSIQADAGWKNYFRLVALVNNTPQWGGEMMTRTFDPVILRFIDLLRKCMPDARDVDLFWCYHFLSGALTLSFSETGRIDRLSGGLCASTDVESLYRRMVPFIAAGFRRVCQPESTAPSSQHGR